MQTKNDERGFLDSQKEITCKGCGNYSQFYKSYYVNENYDRFCMNCLDKAGVKLTVEELTNIENKTRKVSWEYILFLSEDCNADV